MQLHWSSVLLLFSDFFFFCLFVCLSKLSQTKQFITWGIINAGSALILLKNVKIEEILQSVTLVKQTRCTSHLVYTFWRCLFKNIHRTQ